jgi:hypothetical protein
MRYTIEYLTVDNTWEPFATNFTYKDAVDICFAMVNMFELEICKMVEEN